jgi:hypothetical protein
MLQTAAMSLTPKKKEAMKTTTESGDAGSTFVAKQVEEVTPSSLLF